MRNNFLILIIMLGMVIPGFAQERQIVKGTKFTMIPPEGFMVSPTFSGFQHVETNSSIMVTVMKGSFDKVSAGLTGENMKKVGVMVTKRDNLIFNKLPAILLKGTQQAHGINFAKQILVFGDAGKTTMVTGVFPDGREDFHTLVQKSIFSMLQDNSLNDDPIEAARFTIDVSGTNYVIQNNVNNSLSYKLKGDESTNGPLFIATSSIGQATVAKRKMFALNRFMTLPNHEDYILTGMNPIQIDKLNGYEVTGYLKLDNGKVKHTYMVILFDSNSYFILAGLGPQTELINFKKIAASFKRK